MIKPRSYWQASTIGQSAGVLNRDDKFKILIVAILQICLGVLDLIGVLAIGLLGALSVASVQSSVPDSRVSSALEFLHLSNSSFQRQAMFVGILSVLLLVGRTLLSIFFTRRILFFFSRRGAKISANLIAHLLSESILFIQKRTTQEILFSVTRGVELIMVQVLATSVVLVSDISLLIIMGVGLFIVDPVTAIGTFVSFAAVGTFLFHQMHARASELGIRSSQLNISSNEKIVEVFSSYRESVVRNRRDYYARQIGKSRFELADTTAEINFLPYISKYVIETAVVFAALLIGSVQFILQDAVHAVATLAIFLAAGTRITPAVLRLQQGSLQIRGSLGMASPTLTLISELGIFELDENPDNSLDVIHEGFDSNIHIKSASFTYPGKVEPAISDVTLIIPSGSSVAVVGPSGAGKTTLIDILLGVLTPDDGSVAISGLPPKLTVEKWPGAISYVPQDVLISSGSIRENIALGYPPESALDEYILSAVKIAHLEEFVSSLPNGLDTEVGERGARISGGQRQRLGIARAMFTQPDLLVLDEATSSLDGETEAIISDAIHSLRGSTTVVMIAHRLSTVRDVDIVVYLSGGKVISTGTFDQVRRDVPDFDRQAKLMGL